MTKTIPIPVPHRKRPRAASSSPAMISQRRRQSVCLSARTVHKAERQRLLWREAREWCPRRCLPVPSPSPRVQAGSGAQVVPGRPSERCRPGERGAAAALCRAPAERRPLPRGTTAPLTRKELAARLPAGVAGRESSNGPLSRHP